MTLGCGTSKTSKTGRLQLINVCYNYINVRHYIHLLVIIPAMVAMVANMMLWSMLIENL